MKLISKTKEKNVLRRAGLIFLLLCFVLTGCGSKEEATTGAAGDTSASTEGQGGTSSTDAMSLQDEIINLVGTELPRIAPERDEAVALFNAYFAEGSDKNSETWMKTLQDEALPKYDAYLQKLNAIETVHQDVTDLKKLYVESADLQRAAIEDVINAIKNADTSLLDYARTKVEDSEKKLAEYEDKLRGMCSANNINLEGNVVPTEAPSEEGTTAAQ